MLRIGERRCDSEWLYNLGDNVSAVASTVQRTLDEHFALPPDADEIRKQSALDNIEQSTKKTPMLKADPALATLWGSSRAALTSLSTCFENLKRTTDIAGKPYETIVAEAQDFLKSMGAAMTENACATIAGIEQFIDGLPDVVALCDGGSRSELVEQVVNNPKNVALPAVSVSIDNYVAALKAARAKITGGALGASIERAEAAGKKLRIYLGTANAAAVLFIAVPQAKDPAEINNMKAAVKRKLGTHDIELHKYLSDMLAAPST